MSDQLRMVYPVISQFATTLPSEQRRDIFLLLACMAVFSSILIGENFWKLVLLFQNLKLIGRIIFGFACLAAYVFAQLYFSKPTFIIRMIKVSYSVIRCVAESMRALKWASFVVIIVKGFSVATFTEFFGYFSDPQILHNMLVLFAGFVSIFQMQYLTSSTWTLLCTGVLQLVLLFKATDDEDASDVLVVSLYIKLFSLIGAIYYWGKIRSQGLNYLNHALYCFFNVLVLQTLQVTIQQICRYLEKSIPFIGSYFAPYANQQQVSFATKGVKVGNDDDSDDDSDDDDREEDDNGGDIIVQVTENIQDLCKNFLEFWGEPSTINFRESLMCVIAFSQDWLRSSTKMTITLFLNQLVCYILQVVPYLAVFALVLNGCPATGILSNFYLRSYIALLASRLFLAVEASDKIFQIDVLCPYRSIFKGALVIFKMVFKFRFPANNIFVVRFLAKFSIVARNIKPLNGYFEELKDRYKNRNMILCLQTLNKVCIRVRKVIRRLDKPVR
jgi:hypothetical protein